MHYGPLRIFNVHAPLVAANHSSRKVLADAIHPPFPPSCGASPPATLRCYR
jgi:hypothetical protein